MLVQVVSGNSIAVLIPNYISRLKLNLGFLIYNFFIYLFIYLFIYAFSKGGNEKHNGYLHDIFFCSEYTCSCIKQRVVNWLILNWEFEREHACIMHMHSIKCTIWSHKIRVMRWHSFLLVFINHLNLIRE